MMLKIVDNESNAADTNSGSTVNRTVVNGTSMSPPAFSGDAVPTVNSKGFLAIPVALLSSATRTNPLVFEEKKDDTVVISGFGVPSCGLVPGLIIGSISTSESKASVARIASSAEIANKQYGAAMSSGEDVIIFFTKGKYGESLNPNETRDQWIRWLCCWY